MNMKEARKEKFTVQNREEIARIYEMYGEIIKQIAFGIIRDEGMAEDCLHDVIVRLATVLPRPEAIESVETKCFIAVVTRHRAIDLRKKKSRELCTDSENERKNRLSEISVYDDYFVDQNGFSEEMQHYLERFSKKEQTTIILKYIYGMKYAEIAVQMGESKSAIEQRVCRMRKRLQIMIREERMSEGYNA